MIDVKKRIEVLFARTMGHEGKCPCEDCESMAYLMVEHDAFVTMEGKVKFADESDGRYT